ncbi:hypothetical protein [Curtobacterium ammoniigenes]|uniref:hypothetical protein n=1 Tax=Curtobacterium ammoniigenes TaxID=395387 RepID=UPI0008349315|nr:hypothetical protein [Curtobacterium ammoniigenes]
MTEAKPKYHDFEKAEQWMSDSWGMSMSKHIRLGQVVPNELAVHETVLLFSRAAVQDRIEAWKQEDQHSTRGRKAQLSETSVLMLAFVTMRARHSVSIKHMAEVAMALTTAQRLALGITEFTPHQDTMYHRIWEAIFRLRALTDRHPGKRRRRITEAERAAAVGRRDKAEMAKRHQRMLELTNLIIEGSIAFLPREVKRRFRGAAAMDATFIEVSGKQKSAKNIKPGDKVSTNYDCGWYGRQGSHGPDDNPRGLSAFGWELEFLVMTADPNETEVAYPRLFLSTSGHLPGGLAGHGRFLWESAKHRGHTISTLIADRAYFPGAKPEDLQRPLAQAGVKVVMDYKNEDFELTQQAFYKSPNGVHDLIMVTGNWYLGFMPTALIEAEKTYRDFREAVENLPAEEKKQKIAEAHALLRAQREEKKKYRLKPRSGYDLTCARQYTYPEFNDPEVYDERVGAMVSVALPKTVKIPGVLNDEHGKTHQNHIKYGQDLEYKSAAWKAWFGKRNNIENGNSCLKDADRAALAVPMKRRMRGPWIIELAGAMAAATANLSRILDWLKLRLAMRTLNRKNATSAALFEPGLDRLTVDEHDLRNPFNRLAELEELRLVV